MEIVRCRRVTTEKEAMSRLQKQKSVVGAAASPHPWVISTVHSRRNNIFGLLVLTRVMGDVQAYIFIKCNYHASKVAPFVTAFLPKYLWREHYNGINFMTMSKRNIKLYTWYY